MRKHTLETITDRRRERLEQAIRRRQCSLTLVLENVWDPHNVSAILRSADAVGIHTIHLLYTIENPPNLLRHGKQSSASAKKWLSTVVHDSVDACFNSLRSEGFLIYASHLRNNAVGLHELDFTMKLALIVGNENRGVSVEACERADGLFYIPMMGMVESLNVSVAAAVTLYEALRQRSLAGMYENPELGEDGVLSTLRDWAQR